MMTLGGTETSKISLLYFLHGVRCAGGMQSMSSIENGCQVITKAYSSCNSFVYIGTTETGTSRNTSLTQPAKVNYWYLFASVYVCKLE